MNQAVGAISKGRGIPHVQDADEECGIAARKSEAPLEKYGVNSLMIVRPNKILEEDLGAVSKILFFEHRTFSGLAVHLAGSPAGVDGAAGFSKEETWGCWIRPGRPWAGGNRG